MYMPSLRPGGGADHARRRTHFLKPNPMVIYFVLVESLFWAGCAVCSLFALNRIASSTKLEARLKALKAIPDAFTEEERLELIHKIKTRALGSL